MAPRSSSRPSSARPTSPLPPSFAPARPVPALFTTGPPSRAASAPTPAPLLGKSRPATAPAAGGLFSPQSKGLGLDLSEHSPALQRKIVYAGVVASSFATAADLLENLADLSVPLKQVERLTRQIGTERVAQRDRDVTDFQALPLARKFDAPGDVKPPDLAVIMVDGGRLQVRERTATPATPGPTEPEPGEEAAALKGFWREDKVALLLGMKSSVAAVDPCPEIPRGFLDVLRIPSLVRELGKVAARADEGAEDAKAALNEETRGEAAAYEAPGVEHRRVVASCRPWPELAVQVAQAARAAGMQGASRKAFVADGSANNWRLRERYFGSFVAVLDFIHALSYVYAAATAGRSFAAGWACYREWIDWVWQGEVARVIEALSQRQEEVGMPAVEEPETSVRSVVTGALGYLRNHAAKMKYDEYRREGLPITSSLMESAVKQMNQRVKGSEKFWCQQGAEAIVPLRADHLSDDAPLDEFWKHRQDTATGQRPYRRSA